MKDGSCVTYQEYIVPIVINDKCW